MKNVLKYKQEKQVLTKKFSVIFLYFFLRDKKVEYHFFIKYTFVQGIMIFRVFEAIEKLSCFVVYLHSNCLSLLIKTARSKYLLKYRLKK